MRYDAQHKQATHARLLEEAARLLRKDGPNKLAVGAVMAGAGLTHGGFYAHFKSRDALLAAAVAQLFLDGPSRLLASTRDQEPRAALAAYVDFYLSAEHRDSLDAGCPLPVLGTEVQRLPAAAREHFTAGAAALRVHLATTLTALGRPAPEQEASSLLAELVGALLLARAEPDPERSAALLSASRQAIADRLGLEPLPIIAHDPVW